MNPPIEIVTGIPESMRNRAAQLYESAFGEKFAIAFKDQEARLEFLNKTLILPFAFAAVCNDKLVGIAGFNTSEGSLTGGMTYHQLVAQLGIFRGTWGALCLSLYERSHSEGELLLDGISVDPEMRGQGIGTRLLTELRKYAQANGYHSLRLDVIDTNPGARRLYERNGFIPTKTEHFGYLRWFLGFGASTTMIQEVAEPSKAS